MHVQARDADGEGEGDARSRRRSSLSGAAPPSSVKRERSPSASRPRASAAGLTTPLFLVLLATAAAAAFAALAVPYCQHNDCAELARNLPDLVGESATAAWGAARAGALAGADVVQQRLQQLVGGPLWHASAAQGCQVELATCWMSSSSGQGHVLSPQCGQATLAACPEARALTLPPARPPAAPGSWPS